MFGKCIKALKYWLCKAGINQLCKPFMFCMKCGKTMTWNMMQENFSFCLGFGSLFESILFQSTTLSNVRSIYLHYLWSRVTNRYLVWYPLCKTDVLFESYIKMSRPTKLVQCNLHKNMMNVTWWLFAFQIKRDRKYIKRETVIIWHEMLSQGQTDCSYYLNSAN